MTECPKCKKLSGDSWSQCGGWCPMGAPEKPMSANLEALGAALEVIMSASRDDQLIAATSIAGNIGMVLASAITVKEGGANG